MKAKDRRVPGERNLIAGMLVDAVGTGMYVPFSLVFFQRITGLPLPTIGTVLTAAGLLAMGAMPVGGWAVDRFGARRVRLALYLVRGLGFLAFPLGTTLSVFALVATLSAAGAQAFPATQQALIGELTEGEHRDRLMALGRSVNNAGLGAGGLLAAGLVQLAGDDGFLAVAWLNAATFFVAALFALRIRTTPRVRPAAGRQRADYRTVLRDRPYAGLTAANFLIALGYSALSVLLPVYAVSRFDLPASVAGPLFAVNTALCAFAGVPVGTLSRRFARRTRVAAVGAAVFATAFLGFALLDAVPRRGVMAGLVGLLVLYTIGELVHSPSAGALSVSAAPAEARGRYLATYQLSWALSQTLAPSLFTGLLAVDGRLPWLVLAVCSAAGAFLLLVLEPRLPAEAVRTTAVAAVPPTRTGNAEPTAPPTGVTTR
ncbi:MFS transporter [Kitasatospora sp. NPDC001540]|uniref:MFS transporter n=1 Tax=Kitasatospora sp. NPDC001540 TaxID=3364014 RepID=UPI003680F92F